MRYLIIFSAAFSLIVVAPIAYMAADNTPPFEYDYSNSYLFPGNPESGSQVIVHWQFKKVNRICPGIITRIITDQSGSRISYDPIPAANGVNIKDSHLERTFFLPPNLLPGRHWYKSLNHFTCNPLQRIWPLVVFTEGIPFDVVEKPKEPE